jgi:hypothetical protein
MLLWIPTQTGDHTFGIIGAHLAVAHIGVCMYGPPGIFILRQDAGRLDAAAGLTWGFVFKWRIQMPGVRGRRARSSSST